MTGSVVCHVGRLRGILFWMTGHPDRWPGVNASRCVGDRGVRGAEVWVRGLGCAASLCVVLR